MKRDYKKIGRRREILFTMGDNVGTHDLTNELRQHIVDIEQSHGIVKEITIVIKPPFYDFAMNANMMIVIEKENQSDPS